MVVTGTASGKSLCYQLPLLEALLEDPDTSDGPGGPADLVCLGGPCVQGTISDLLAAEDPFSLSVKRNRAHLSTRFSPRERWNVNVDLGYEQRDGGKPR